MAMMDSLKRLLRVLRANTSLSVIIAAAILLQFISAVQYYYTRGLLAEELEKRAESELTIKAIIVKNTLKMSENALNGHILNLQRNITNQDAIYDIAEWVMKSHPNLLGCGIAFLPDHFLQDGKLSELYVYRGDWRNVKEDNTENLKRLQFGSGNHDYLQMPFYEGAIERNTPYWTTPYRHAISDKQIVSFCRPVYNEQDEVMAVFGLDIALDWLGDTLNYRHIHPSSFDLLLTETGELIAGPNGNKIWWKDAEMITEMINDSTVEKSKSNSGRSRFFNIIDREGNRGRVYFTSFKGTPKWQVAVVCYDHEVYGKLKSMRRNIGLLMLVGILVLILIVNRYVKNSRNLQIVNMEKERISSELRIAHDIQRQMLPTNFPQHDEIDAYGMLLPAREVGGDLFDFFLRDEKLVFCIGDVSGKGVPSAMVMAVIHSMFRMASAHENNPARIMQNINEASCEGNDSNMFVTLFIGILDLPTGRLRYCNAGHDVPVVIGRGPLPAKANLPVGLFGDFTYEMQEFTLEWGSTLFLYTDGLTEAKNSSHELFGLERMTAALDRFASLPPKQLLEKVTEEVHAFVEDAEQSDDLTMFVFRYSPVVRDLTLDEELTLQNDVRQVRQLNEFVKQVMSQLSIEPSLAKKLRLAVEEAVVNVIDYAYPAGVTGDITVQASFDNQCLRFVIKDSGVAFDPTEKEKADTSLSAEDRPIGGLGILLVRELMDSINYERLDGMNVLTLKKTINIKQ